MQTWAIRDAADFEVETRRISMVTGLSQEEVQARINAMALQGHAWRDACRMVYEEAVAAARPDTPLIDLFPDNRSWWRKIIDRLLDAL